MSPQYGVVGCLTLDNVIAHGGERYARVAGGNVLYTALGVMVWSPSVGIVSRAGSDYPQRTLAALADIGVDVGGVTVRDGPHEFNVAFAYSPNGDRTRTVSPQLLATLPADERRFYHDTTSDEVLRLDYAPDPADIPPSWLPDTLGWHLASLPRTKQASLAQALRDSAPSGTVTTADGVDAKDLGPETALSDFGYVSTLDALLPSEADLTIPGLGEPFQRISALRSLAVPTVAMKFGPRGSVVTTDLGSWHVPVAAVEAVDPTGAGDAYCGGFLVGYTETRDPVEAAVYGTVAASYIVEAVGPVLNLSVERDDAQARAAAVRARVRRIGHDPVAAFGRPPRTNREGTRCSRLA